jgi:hypothetical protein
MTSGRVFAIVAAALGVVGLAVAVTGQVQRDAYTVAGGMSCILLAIVWAILSFRDL